jgi:phospholipid/cholesterol/gamma-HCH transport system permease protein
VMGISPIQRLVAPRILAAIVVALLLTVIVAMTAMITAFIMNVGGGSISSGAYLDSFVSFSRPADFVLAEVKALIFGFLATVVAAHKGLNASGGPKGVADAVNEAVVLSVILLAVTNVAITQGYVMVFPQGLA